ncbi:MAG: energy transducer TonB [bacterium]
MVLMNVQAKTIRYLFPYGAPEMLEVYHKHLAWAMTSAILFQALGLGTWIGARILSEEPEAPMVRIRVIKDVAELGPPPSIAAPAAPAIAVSGPAVRPSIGVPVPVPDAQITEEATIATQDELAQMQALFAGEGTAGGGDSLIVSDEGLLFGDEEPPIDAFIPYQTPPAIVKRVEPVYPELARKAGMQGRVFVKILIDKEGKVKRAVVIQGPEILHEAAVSAVVQWVFKPAIQHDRPIAVWMVIPVLFQLRE